MPKDDFEQLHKKVFSKHMGEKELPPDYEFYKEKDKTPYKRYGWMSTKDGKGFSLRKLFFLSFVLFLSVFIYFVFFYDAKFKPTLVNVYITGPSNVVSGDLVSYKIHYKNNSKTILRDAVVYFEWPQGFDLKGSEYENPVVEKRYVGTIMPTQEKVVSIEGRLYGNANDVKTIKVRLEYKPEDINNVFSSEARYDVNIVSVPIFLNVIAPKQISAGDEFTIRVEYNNQSDASFSNMEIQAEYPSGFEFISSNPNPSVSNNVWQLGTIQGGESESIQIKGKLSGNEGENKVISFKIGKVGEDANEFVEFANFISEVKLSSSVLLVLQKANESRDLSVNPGDVVTYTINYKNNSTEQVSDVVVVAQLDATYLDLKSLDMPWGFFDGRTNSIIWNQTGVPDLAVLDPGEEGKLTFSVKVRDNIIPKTTREKNLYIKTIVQIASGSLPDPLSSFKGEYSDELMVKINTKAKFKVDGYFSQGPIKNYGSLPPKVGEEVSYAVSWKIFNTTNDLKDVEVRAFLPPTVKWTGVVNPNDANIKFNKEKGLIVWRPQVVFAGSGYVIPAQRVDFQVAYTPSLLDVGKDFTLVKSIKMTAEDAFTGKKIEIEAGNLKSDLGGNLKASQSRVIQN